MATSERVGRRLEYPPMRRGADGYEMVPRRLGLERVARPREEFLAELTHRASEALKLKLIQRDEQLSPRLRELGRAEREQARLSLSTFGIWALLEDESR